VTKRDFVQHYVLRWFNRTRTGDPGMSRLIYEGECLWKHISKHGYGASQERGPREHMDWYGSLTELQGEWFDEFWDAFSYKQGRNEAAMCWFQINPDPDTAAHIIHAAGLEAEKRKRLPDGQTPIMAQGWLNARRWEDYPEPQSQRVASRRDADRAERGRLRSEIAHLERLLAYQDNEQLRAQRDELRGRLAVLEEENDG
jgi:hypothetical protein